MSGGAGAEVPRLARISAFGGRTAIVDGAGSHTYGELVRTSERVAKLLRAEGGASGLEGRPVPFLADPGLEYACTLLGIWLAGGMAVPLCTFHPPPELAYALDDTAAPLAACGPRYEARLGPLCEGRGTRLVRVSPGDPVSRTPARARRSPWSFRPDAPALLLYTSGTTRRPKGVVHTHGSLAAQVESLLEAWGWRPEDRILHSLPLHHTHGIVNAFLCPLAIGAACEMADGFDAEVVWERFVAAARGDREPITLFMAVPTIYAKLIASWERASEGERARRSEAAARLRLMVSGSAALPVRVFERWKEIAGHTLLERYGMTEIGMALSNPLAGERRPGTVGRPLPGVRLRLVGENGEVLAEDPPRVASESERPAAQTPAVTRGPLPPDAGPGEIEVQGPGLFREYWNRPEETRAAFRDGWFRTGDVAVVERGYWRILGRSSVDILKTGGYKVSALEIEEVLREHPGVQECAVVGVPDAEWGEVVAAAVVPSAGAATGADPARALVAALDEWSRAHLATYKVPRRWRVVGELPRNAMGKVTKPTVRRLFEGASRGGRGAGRGRGPPRDHGDGK